MKGSYGDPENTGVGYNTIIKELGDHSVPAEWAQYVKHNTEADTAPGAPIQWDDPSDPESALPGYGFVADNSGEPEETFYYHSDHLGSTSYITDEDGNITQYDAYLPYGELLVDEHSSSEEMPYKFNGKELDEETGLYYYGARYMQPVSSIWYGVDPLTEKYARVSGYAYCMGNPINAIDPNGGLVIFISGMYFKPFEGGSRSYWNGLDDRVSGRLHDPHRRYYDGSSDGFYNLITHGLLNGNLNPKVRQHWGKLYGYNHAKEIFESLRKGETIKIVTHSMGAAYGKGFIKGLKKYAKENNIDIDKILTLELDMAPFQPKLQEIEIKNTITISHKYDNTAGSSPIENADNHITRKEDKYKTWSLTKEHSVDSFTQQEILNYVPEGDRTKGGKCDTWEQKGRK